MTPETTAPPPSPAPHAERPPSAGPGSAALDALRYGWRLPRRRGAYLTGTAGKDRLGGLDAARGLALIGMMAAHVGLTSCGLTSLAGLLNQAHGRAAVLFAVIAGFSLGIMSGRTTPHTGDALVRTRLRLLVRSALLLVAGAGLAMLGSPVAVILGYYAAWLALALPFLRWRPRNLFILAAATAAVGPLVIIGAPVALDRLGMTAFPSVMDGNSALMSFFITGYYPGAVWMAYIFLGLGLSRLDWSRSRNLWRLAVVGALCAIVGYGSGWAAGRAIDPELADTYHLVSPADASQCEGGSRARLAPADGGRADAPIEPADADPPSDPASADAPGSMPWDESQDAPGTDAPGDGVVGDRGAGGPDGSEAPAPELLATAAPHTNTPFDALGAGGTAMTVIALLQLVSRRLRPLISPLAAAGSMSLTVYCGHVIAVWALGMQYYPQDNLVWVAMSAGFIALAMVWFAVWARGPLEHLVHVVSMRATRAED